MENEEIKKVDFTSEYPHVNKNGLYPVGNPVEITAPEQYGARTMKEVLEDLLKTDDELGLDPVGNPHFTKGLFVMNADYIPPKGLKIPVLWSKVDCSVQKREDKTRKGAHKLVFDLNRHDDQWMCSIEVYEAMKKGYRFENIKKIIWWDKEHTTRGLFQDYVNVFLKMKIEAEGWPKENMTEKEKQDYIQMIHDKNPGVWLDPEKIAYNPVMRTIAKLMLNSIWGKFNQRSNMGKTMLLKPHEYPIYWAYMTNEEYHTKLSVLIPGKVAEMKYTNTNDHIVMAKNTCITIGAFTTAQGRMMWYRLADKLDPDQVLYGDTDSLMYVYNRNIASHKLIETFEGVLGAPSDEFKKKKNKVCVEFVSGGPKNYGYMLVDKDHPWDGTKWDVELKIKGFNLRTGAADKNSARNMLTYRKVVKLIITNALKSDPTLQQSVLDQASIFDDKENKDPNDSEDELVDRFLENNLNDEERITVKERRFVKTNDFRIENATVDKSYGYVYNKAQVDVQGSTPYKIRCLPFGYHEAKAIDWEDLPDEAYDQENWYPHTVDIVFSFQRSVSTERRNESTYDSHTDKLSHKSTASHSKQFQGNGRRAEE